MFIISFLTVLYGLLCAFIILMVLVQRGKGGMGIGYMGGGNQALFGSSGGQDIFQKITWICCVILLAGSLFLSVLKGKYNTSRHLPPMHTQQAAESAHQTPTDK